MTVEISVVIPCFNEEENVRAIVEAVGAELAGAQATYEIILIDNASQDRTVAIAKEICAADPRVRLIVNSRNFGQMRSPTYGIYQARGQAVIGMCADFQDPPSMLGQFIARWRSGTKIILGVREEERESPLWLRFLRRLGYGFFERFADVPVIRGATGFGLYDRTVVDCLARWREPEPFFRAMLVETGFSLETIPYQRPPRAGGRSSNNLLTLAGFMISGVAGCSKQLLRLPIWLAAFGFLFGIPLAVLLAVGAVLGWAPWAALLITLGELQLALLLLFVGLIGEQVRVISERTRETPLVIEQERVNFSADTLAAPRQSSGALTRW